MQAQQGLIALAGSGEYLPAMEAVDRQLLQATGQARPCVVCLPTAAGREGLASVERWSQMGQAHFGRLGADVSVARVVDRKTAGDPRWVELLERADLIYFSGGDPLHLLRSLDGSPAWAAIQRARARGAVYAGCSAGAMVMGSRIPDVRSLGLRLHPAFNQVPGALILPHFDRLEGFRPGVTAYLRARLSAGQFGLGIDEDTALVGQASGEWQVQGAGGVTVLGRDGAHLHPAGSRLRLPEA